MMVFVIDKNKKPLHPVTKQEAMKLLNSKKAVKHLEFPLVIRKKSKENSPPGLTLKIDRGAKESGFAILDGEKVLWLATLEFRGERVKSLLEDRSTSRRRRRTVNIRSRPVRYKASYMVTEKVIDKLIGIKKVKFSKDSLKVIKEKFTLDEKIKYKDFYKIFNTLPLTEQEKKAFEKVAKLDQDPRKNKDGWIAPSLKSRHDNLIHWVKKITSFCPISKIVLEHNNFDIQKLDNPGINGIEYQRGSLYEFELMEYLKEKYNYTCVYCGKGIFSKEQSKNIIPVKDKDGRLHYFNKDHVIPRSKGGHNRPPNLVLSCVLCNRKKGNMPLEEFLKGQPEKIKKIKAELKQPLKDATCMNILRWRTFEDLQKIIGKENLECGTGARTKHQRVGFNLPKNNSEDGKKIINYHYYDACCVGESTPLKLEFLTEEALRIKAMGRGSRSKNSTDTWGFPAPKLKIDDTFLKEIEWEISKETLEILKGFKGKGIKRKNRDNPYVIEKDVKHIRNRWNYMPKKKWEFVGLEKNFLFNEIIKKGGKKEDFKVLREFFGYAQREKFYKTIKITEDTLKKIEGKIEIKKPLKKLIDKEYMVFTLKEKLRELKYPLAEREEIILNCQTCKEFLTNDMCRKKGSNITGPLGVRKTGAFYLKVKEAKSGRVSVTFKECEVIQRYNGYQYFVEKRGESPVIVERILSPEEIQERADSLKELRGEEKEKEEENELEQIVYEETEQLELDLFPSLQPTID